MDIEDSTKKIPRKMFTMWKLSSYGCHIGIQDGRHIIRHAVFHDRQMSLTLSVVTEKVVISPFCSDLTRFNKISTQATPHMAVDKEAISLSRVYSYYS